MNTCTTCGHFRYMDDYGAMGWCCVGRDPRRRPAPEHAYDGGQMGSTCRCWTHRCRECGDQGEVALPTAEGDAHYCVDCARELGVPLRSKGGER